MMTNYNTLVNQRLCNMNFKSFTINLLLTTLSGGILMQTLEAQAASITFGTWNFNPATVTTTSRFATGNGNATPRTLKAFAAAAATTDDPSSWGRETARTIISLSNFFTVTPGTGERNGDQVRGILSGRLEGVLGSIGEDTTTSFLTLVRAEIDAGFTSWSQGFGTSGSGQTRQNVNQPFNQEGILTIGERYPFRMSLEVYAEKGGISQAFSNFGGEGRGLTANIQAVPEPLTILGSATGVGFAAFFKRKHSKKQKKS
jgi:hypothetical protein